MSKKNNDIALAKKINDQTVKEIFALKGVRPNLAVIVVGKNKKTVNSVKAKEKEAKKVGIDTHVYKCADNTDSKELLEAIVCLNKDDLIDGILIELPLPKGFDAEEIIKSINEDKNIHSIEPVLLAANPLAIANIFQSTLALYKARRK
ncbi:hypothetical protein K8R32_00380 [bacterium]|nr:hypothetical protein [bacterium]